MIVKWLSRVAVCMLLAGGTAFAQTGTAASEPKRFLSAAVGVSIGEKAGTVVALDGGWRLWRKLDVILEGSWSQNTVTGKQLDRASVIAGAIAQAEGGEASSDVDMPVLYGGIGARWVFEETGTFRPYVQLTVGGVRGDLKSSFSLNGSDITGSLGDYGVTLGDDLKGTFGSGAVSGGAGMTMERGSYFLTGDLQVLSFSVRGDHATSTRLTFGAGFRF